jgi:hypothetical protein
MDDIRTAQLVQEIEELKRKTWEQEIIIRKYEKDMQAIAEVLGNISKEAFK